jgi:hypothetical protein
MQWKTITTGLGSKAYGLWNDGQKMLTLAYNNIPDTIYCESENGEKRLLRYRKSGLFRNKLVLENEYGVNLGELEKEGAHEYVIVDDKKFFLKYKNDSEVEIIDEELHQSLATCSLEYDNPNSKTDNNLLMVLCLYIFRKQKVHEVEFTV